MSYKAIFFDLDNTLLNYTVSELKSMRHTLRVHGLIEAHSLTWEQFWGTFSRINMVYWNERVKHGYTIYQVLEYSFRDTLNELQVESQEAKRLAQMYWNTFCTACDFETHATEILSYFHGTYSLAIISNGIGEAQRGRLKAGQIDHYFDTLVISDEVGHWKPSKEIFDEALKRLDIHHSEALFVGDSLQDDYKGALNAGLDFCYYNREGNLFDAHIRPKYMIESLHKLKSFLG